MSRFLFTVMALCGATLATVVSVRAEGEYSVQFEGDSSSAIEDLSLNAPPAVLPGAMLGIKSGIDSSALTTQLSFSVSGPSAAIVVVGATATDYRYDEAAKRIDLTITFSNETIIAPSFRETGDADKDGSGKELLEIEIPDRAFLVYFEPGTSGLTSAFATKRYRTQRARISAADTSCFGIGPRSQLSDLLDNADSDFGDVRLPLSIQGAVGSCGVRFNPAMGTFVASTNAFFWELVAPLIGRDQAPYYAGLRVSGPAPGRGQTALRARVTLGAPAELVAALSSSGGLDTLAVHSGATDLLQVSNQVVNGASGYAYASVSAKLEKDSSDTENLALPSGAGQQSIRSETDAFVDRIITLGDEVEVALLPPNGTTTISKGSKDVEFEGTCAEIGARVTVFRVDSSRDCPTGEIAARAANGSQKFVPLGSATVGADGTYNVRVQTSALFPGGRTRSTVSSRVGDERGRESTQLSLSRRGGQNRR